MVIRPGKCHTCGQYVTPPKDAVFDRGYWWHAPCYRHEFPSLAGRVIPNTIITPDIEEEEWCPKT